MARTGGDGKYAQAIESVEQALELVPERNVLNDRVFTRAQSLLGGFYMFRGENERSEKAFRLSRERAAETGDPMVQWASSLNLDTAQFIQQDRLDAVERLAQQHAGIDSPFRRSSKRTFRLLPMAHGLIRHTAVVIDIPECL